MADGYTKLFASITDSTIWEAPDTTRLVWITMLAMADQDGYVGASVPGLAARARVALDDCVKALDTFKSPDEWSRSKDYDGRRIVDADGGWILLNHGKYRAIRDAEARREQARLAMAKLRAERKGVSPVTNVSNVSHGEPRLAYTEADTEAKKKSTVRPSASRFDEWYAIYPSKKGKEPARKTWLREKLDAHADDLIAHTKLMIAYDDAWRRGFVPMASTYLNQRRWQDEPGNAPQANGQKLEIVQSNKTVKQAFTPSETPLERDIARARQDYHFGQIDATERDKRIAAATQLHREKGNGH